jgi:tRNA threonylcarbamoyladenosine biosynthesis protein TsaB
LRVGVATAKAMAYALKIPVVEVDTLDVIARQCSLGNASVFAVLDAYRGQVFCAEYSIRAADDRSMVGESIEKISSTEILNIADLLKRLRDRVSDANAVCLCGPGCARVRKHLTNPESAHGMEASWFFESVRWLDGVETNPQASSVAWLGLEKLRKGDVLSPFSVQPRYYRVSAAEEVAAKAK